MGQIVFHGKEVKPVTKNKFDERREIHVLMDKGMHKVKTGIYKLYIDDHFYIGRANNIRTRAKQHMKQMEYMIHYNKAEGAGNKKMLAYLLAHPKCDRIRIEILEECSLDSLNEKEQYWLSAHKDDPKLLNILKKANRMADDVSRQEFVPGIYKIEYKIESAGQYIAYKKMIKEFCAIGGEFVKPLTSKADG